MTKTISNTTTIKCNNCGAEVNFAYSPFYKSLVRERDLYRSRISHVKQAAEEFFNELFEL